MRGGVGDESQIDGPARKYPRVINSTEKEEKPAGKVPNLLNKERSGVDFESDGDLEGTCFSFRCDSELPSQRKWLDGKWGELWLSEGMSGVVGGGNLLMVYHIRRAEIARRRKKQPCPFSKN